MANRSPTVAQRRRARDCTRQPARRRWTVRALVAVVAFAAIGGVEAADPFLRRTATVEVVESVGPAVVSIATERVSDTPNPFRTLDPDQRRVFEFFFRDLFDQQQAPQQNLGSGVIIDARGHVLTNSHVVERATRIRVGLSDGREFAATVVGADPNNDIGVLLIETEETLPWVAPGGSDDIFVGEPVIAIGNPFGLSNSVTTGVISATERSFRAGDRSFHGFLQTDASINPGNSGGPLLNAEGSLIGINTAMYNGAQGIGFAVPIDVAKRVMAELIEHGEVQPVWLGLDFQDLDPALHEALGLPDNIRGVLVNQVVADSPAALAGIRRGDIATHLDGRPIQSALFFFETLDSMTVGQKIEVEMWRNDETRTIALTATEIPEDVIAQLTMKLLGMELREKRGAGFEIADVATGSPAAHIGLQQGDFLIGLNGITLDGPDALRRAVLDLRGRQRALAIVRRGTGQYHVTIPMV